MSGAGRPCVVRLVRLVAAVRTLQARDRGYDGYELQICQLTLSRMSRILCMHDHVRRSSNAGSNPCLGSGVG